MLFEKILKANERNDPKIKINIPVRRLACKTIIKTRII
jgi:hypothetical protein